MPTKPPPFLRSVHKALADPLRLRLLEALWLEPRSARELAEREGLPTERLYYHLGQLEQARLVRIAEYRPLPGGKVERVYAATTDEPPGDESSPEDLARFLSAVLQATSADVTRACQAKEAGGERRVLVHRVALRLTAAQRDQLEASLIQPLDEAASDQDDDGTWTRVLVTMVDLQDRGDPPGTPRQPLSVSRERSAMTGIARAKEARLLPSSPLSSRLAVENAAGTHHPVCRGSTGTSPVPVRIPLRPGSRMRPHGVRCRNGRRYSRPHDA